MAKKTAKKTSAKSDLQTEIVADKSVVKCGKCGTTPVHIFNSDGLPVFGNPKEATMVMTNPILWKCLICETLNKYEIPNKTGMAKQENHSIYQYVATNCSNCQARIRARVLIADISCVQFHKQEAEYFGFYPNLGVLYICKKCSKQGVVKKWEVQ